MKRLIGSTLVALMVFAANVYGGTSIYRATLADESALAYDNTYTLDLAREDIGSLSMMAVYSSATVPAVTFLDGRPSTGTITVASTSGLVAVAATDTVTVASNTVRAIGGSIIFVNGRPLVEGYEWARQAVSSNTAISIKNAVNNMHYSVTASTTAATVVTLTCTTAGSFCNNYTLTTSTPAALVAGSAKFTGGKDNAYLVINGTPLTQGTDWTRVATASGTAKAISDAIMANTSLNSIIHSTWTSGGVIYATSTLVGAGTNYGLYSSTPAALTISGTSLKNGAADAVDTTNGQIIASGYQFTTGLPVLFGVTAGTPPGTLVAGTTYYAIPVNGSHFKLASSLVNAKAGTAVGISTQTAGGRGVFTLAPLALAGTMGLKWQESNDGSNWIDMSVSSVTFASPYTAGSSFWDFGTINMRYIRLNVTGPTAGGLDLNVTGSGKRVFYR